MPNSKGARESRLPVGRLTEADMLYWALVFLVIAIIAGFLGFGGVAFAAAESAKILCFLFLVAVIVMLFAGLMGRRRTPPISRSRFWVSLWRGPTPPLPFG